MSGAPDVLRETRLGFVLDEQDPPARLGQRPREMVAGRGLADPALLVQEGDDGQGRSSSRGGGQGPLPVVDRSAVDCFHSEGILVA